MLAKQFAFCLSVAAFLLSPAEANAAWSHSRSPDGSCSMTTGDTSFSVQLTDDETIRINFNIAPERGGNYIVNFGNGYDEIITGPDQGFTLSFVPSYAALNAFMDSSFLKVWSQSSGFLGKPLSLAGSSEALRQLLICAYPSASAEQINAFMNRERGPRANPDVFSIADVKLGMTLEESIEALAAFGYNLDGEVNSQYDMSTFAGVLRSELARTGNINRTSEVVPRYVRPSEPGYLIASGPSGEKLTVEFISLPDGSYVDHVRLRAGGTLNNALAILNTIRSRYGPESGTGMIKNGLAWLRKDDGVASEDGLAALGSCPRGAESLFTFAGPEGVTAKLAIGELDGTQGGGEVSLQLRDCTAQKEQREAAQNIVRSLPATPEIKF